MSKKPIQFEELHLTEAKLMQKFAVEKDGYMRFEEQMIEGLGRFHDIWKDNQAMLEAHPRVLEAFATSVRELTDGYLKSGEFRHLNEEQKAPVRLRVVNFRDTVDHHLDLVKSAEVEKARTFVAASVDTKKSNGTRVKPEASPVQTVAKDDAPEQTQEGSERIVNLTINVSQGGNVFINNTPEGWAASVPAAQSASDIAAKGPQRRSGRSRKPR